MMKKTLIAASVAASLIVPASAGIYIPPKPAIVKAENLELSKHMLLGMPLTMGMLPGKGGPPSITYLGSSSTITGSTSISGSFNVGAVDANKEVFVAFQGFVLTTGTMSATTFGGATATKATSDYPSTDGAHYAACFFASLPTQSGSQTFTLTFSSAGNFVGGNIRVYVVLNRPGKGNQQSGAVVGTFGAATTFTVSTVTIPANGFLLAVAGRDTAGGVYTSPGGLYTADVTNTSNWAGHTDFQTSSSTPSSTWSWTTSSAYTRAVWAFA